MTISQYFVLCLGLIKC